MRILLDKQSKNTQALLKALPKQGMPIELWTPHTQLPQHSEKTRWYIDSHTDLSYVDYVHMKGTIYFLNNQIPRYGGKNCIPLDFSNCADDIRFTTNNDVHKIFEIYNDNTVFYSRIKTSIEIPKGIIIAGPQYVDSPYYIGNLLDREVIPFLQAAKQIYTVDDYLLPELYYYGLKDKPEDYILTTYKDKVLTEYVTHFK